MAHCVTEGVWWIPGRDSFLPDSHVYLIGQPDSQDFTMVDCGLMEMGSYKIAQLDKCGVSPNHVRRIIMTHTHLDHIGCLPEILEAIPHAEVLREDIRKCVEVCREKKKVRIAELE